MTYAFLPGARIKEVAVFVLDVLGLQVLRLNPDNGETK